MDQEYKFLATATSLAILCLTGFGGALLVILWQYRIWVALSLVGVFEIIVLVLVGIAGYRSYNELQIRHKRARDGEYPLDREGQPYYMPKHAQVYPRQQAPTHSQSYYVPYQYHPYQAQERNGSRP